MLSYRSLLVLTLLVSSSWLACKVDSLPVRAPRDGATSPSSTDAASGFALDGSSAPDLRGADGPVSLGDAPSRPEVFFLADTPPADSLLPRDAVPFELPGSSSDVATDTIRGSGGIPGFGGFPGTGGRATGGASGGGGLATGGTRSGGASGTAVCPSTNPTFSLVEGFEGYAAGSLDTISSSWVRYSVSRTAEVSASWAHTGRNALEVASFTTSTEIDYLPLALPGPARDIVVELWFAPDGFYVYKDFATLGVGTASDKYDFTPTFQLGVSDHSMTARTSVWGPQEIWSGVNYGTLTGSPIFNYVRLEFALCDGTVAVYAGADANATLQATIPLPADFSFNAFFILAGLNPTHLDDVVIYTPGTTVDRTPLQSAGPAVLSSFPSPGSSCTALAWDGASFWFLDDIGRMYQLSSTGQILKTIDAPDVAYASDFAWDGSSLWALDVGYDTGAIVRVDTDGHALGQVGPVDTWSWGGLAWDGQYFWVGDYNMGTMRKYDTTGRLILKWDAASFDHPRGMAATSEGIWYAAGSELYYQSFLGDVLQSLSLTEIGLKAGGYCLEWDGTHLWYSAGFEVSQIALKRPGT